jgi:nitrite reductase (NO-forming)
MVILSATLMGLAALACNEGEERVYQAELLAPPQVPERVNREAGRVVVHLEVIEKEVEIAPDVTYKAWTFNGTVPGPLIRVRVGTRLRCTWRIAGLWRTTSTSTP